MEHGHNQLRRAADDRCLWHVLSICRQRKLPAAVRDRRMRMMLALAVDLVGTVRGSAEIQSPSD